MKKFEPISKEEREILEEALVTAVKEQFQKVQKENEYFQYDVELQSIKFRTCMTHEQLKQAASYTVDILEEMKEINNSGVNRAKFEELKDSVDKEIKSEKSMIREVSHAVVVMTHISTEKLDNLVNEIAELRNVGGAYWMLMSHPAFRQALFAVYDVIVDRFEEKEERNWYDISAFFLMRAIMRVRSEEIDEKE